jgi:hypothetical protein
MVLFPDDLYELCDNTEKEVDIEVTYSGGKSKVTGMPISKVKAMKKQYDERTDRCVSIDFPGTQKIDEIRPDGSVNRNVCGDDKK